MDRQTRSLLLTPLPGGSLERDRFVDAWLPGVVRWCTYLGGPRVDPEDAAHDILIVALRRYDSLTDPSQAAAWLFGITRRVLAQHRRKAWVRRWIPGLDLDPADRARGPAAVAASTEASSMVQGILDALPPDERQVLVLCLLEERSDREVADMLGIPHGTVKSRLRRARSHFLVRAQGLGLEAEDE